MAGGSAIGQLFVVAATPLLARMFSPEEFGALAVFASVTSVIGMAAALRYELAIPLVSSARDAVVGVSVALLAASGTSVVLALVLAAWADPLLTMIGGAALVEFWWLLPLGVFATGAYQVAMHWGIRESAYSDIARTQATKGAAESGTQLVWGALAMGGPVGLLAGYVAGRAAGCARLLASAWAAWRRETGCPKTREMAALVRRYRRMPGVATPSSLVNTAGMVIAPVLIATSFGVATAGLYAVAYRAVVGPASILGKAISHVFLGSVSTALRDGQGHRIPALLDRSMLRLALLGLPALIGLVAVGPDLFAWLLGESWRAAGEYARVLSLAAYVQFTVSPVSQALHLLERHGIQLAWDVLRLTAVILAISGSAVSGASALWAMTALSGVLALCYGLLILIVRRAVRPRVSAESSEDCR